MSSYPKNLSQHAPPRSEAEVTGRPHRLPPGECSFCDEHRLAANMPSHTASRNCESGGHAHCTCDVCF